MKISKLAKQFNKKLIKLATREAYMQIKQIATLGKEILANSLSFQRAALNESEWSTKPNDIYEEAESELAEKKVVETRKLVKDIAQISSDMERNAYLYGMAAKTVSEFKNELLRLADRLIKTDSSGEGLIELMLKNFTNAVKSLRSAPVFKQNYESKETLPEMVIKDEDEKSIPLPPGLFETKIKQFEPGLTPNQQGLVERIRRTYKG